MFSTKEELEITVNCLINKIYELNMKNRILEDKNKSFNQVLENYQNEKSKIKEFEERIFNLEMENGKLKKENEILKKKTQTKDEVKKIMENLGIGGENEKK